MSYDIRNIHNINQLIMYFSKVLNWDIDIDSFDDIDDISYDFSASDLGLKEEAFAKIQSIKQLPPMVDGQKWGIFCIEFDSKRFEVTALRKVLSGLVPSRRNSADHAVWSKEDLLFLCFWGEDNNRTIGIAHFEEDELKTIVKTRVNSKMANFQYASPEQRELGTTITYKSDIFSLGLILNEMFTKKVPSGSSYKRVIDVNKEYAFIDKVIDKMIAQNSKDRYDSINEIVSDIRTLVRVHEKELELQKIKEIEYKESEEHDILILEPPKLVDFKYNDTLNTLYLYLDKEVNQFWVDCITKGSYTSIWGKGPETFRFEGKIAMAKIMPYEINELQTVIDYFKSWVNNANINYSRLIKAERERTRLENQRRLEERIKREEKINDVLKTIRI